MLTFRIERLTPATIKPWQDYYTSEKSIYRTLVEAKSYLARPHTLFETPRMPRSRDPTRSGLSEQAIEARRNHVQATRAEIRKLFELTPSDAGRLQRFLLKYDPDDWQDPVRMAVILPFDPAAPPMYMVCCTDDDGRIVMSMMVVVTELRDFQYHQYIFASLAYLIYRTNNELPSHGPLALQLHAYAGKKIGARTIVSFPKEGMRRMMIAAGGRTAGTDAPEIDAFNHDHHDFIWRYCVRPANICLTNDTAFHVMCPAVPDASD